MTWILIAKILVLWIFFVIGTCVIIDELRD
jgi:hypothetical protein